jgi:hypothetical protein
LVLPGTPPALEAAALLQQQAEDAATSLSPSGAGQQKMAEAVHQQLPSQ